VVVAHACNPNFSGSRDQENLSLKPAQENCSRDLISKKPITQKKGLAESKPQYHKKKIKIKIQFLH
jgi:hypothetical protein